MRVALGLLSAALVLGLATQAAQAQSDELVVLETELGTITIELFDEDAPLHAENFRMLAGSGAYDSTLFHRIIPGFMIQGGDPNTIDGEPSTWGTGGPSGSVPAEFNDIRHERGIVSMARSGDPDSAGSQFFIVHQPSGFLDEQYTVFGRIVTDESFEVLDMIAALETGESDRPVDISSARVHSASIIPRSEAGQLLDQGPVLRISDEPAEPDAMDADEAPPITSPNLQDGVYTNKKLDVTFVPPEGWTIAEPPKTRPHIPDVAIISAGDASALPSAITLSIEYESDRGIEAYADEKIELYAPAIDAGSLTIDSRENTVVAGRDSVVLDASGTIARPGEEVIDVMFREVIFAQDDKLYSFTYNAMTADFDANLDEFDSVLGSFALPSASGEDSMEGSDGDSMAEADGGGGCLIATAAYGTEMSHDIQMLREIRDNTLMSTAAGSAFMAGFNDIYYAFSPAVADLERQSPEFRTLVRALITPMIASLSIMSVADGESDTVLLGSLVIALNLGLYAGAPAALALGIRRRRMAHLRSD